VAGQEEGVGRGRPRRRGRPRPRHRLAHHHPRGGHPLAAPRVRVRPAPDRPALPLVLPAGRQNPGPVRWRCDPRPGRRSPRLPLHRYRPVRAAGGGEPRPVGGVAGPRPDHWQRRVDHWACAGRSPRPGWRVRLRVHLPPYHNLERYSDDPADLSAMGWEEFLVALGGIVAAALDLLAPDRFATWVVGDLRGPDGYLRRLPARVDTMHEAAGARLVNDTVIASPLGGKYGVIWRSWTPTRSATRIHSHAHTYVKGDRRRATAAVGGDS